MQVKIRLRTLYLVLYYQATVHSISITREPNQQNIRLNRQQNCRVTRNEIVINQQQIFFDFGQLRS